MPEDKPKKGMTAKQKNVLKSIIAFFALIASAFAGSKVAPLIKGGEVLTEQIIDAVPTKEEKAKKVAPPPALPGPVAEPVDTDLK